MENHKIDNHNYADDTLIYIMISPGDYGSLQAVLKCIEHITDCQNFQQLKQKR